ncbi:Methylaspartate mutase E chain [compost metagenome]
MPTASSNIAGLRLTRAALSGRLATLPLPQAHIVAEREQILAETSEIVEPVLSAPDIVGALVEAFASGRLDIPFPANPVAQGDIYPVRDAAGAIRFGRTGNLPFSERTLRGATCTGGDKHPSLSEAVRDSLFYFSTLRA